jgi:hypothetical protein
MVSKTAPKTTAMYGLYDEPDGAERAFTALRRAGVGEKDITVISSEPFEHHEFSHRDRSAVLFRLAGVGGVLGFIVGVSLTAGTERAWAINVGGMPTVAWWPNLVIIFELTMLSAILTTVVSLLVAARLPSRVKGLYDPEVSDGRILVGVPITADRAPDTIRRALDVGGALAVKTADFQS